MRERERERERTHTHTDMTGVEGKCVVKGATNKYKCRKKKKNKKKCRGRKKSETFSKFRKGSCHQPLDHSEKLV